MSLSKLLVLGAFVASFGFKALANDYEIEGAKAQKISVMSYNVENLFDTVKDAGKEDWEYLPRSKKNTPEHREYCLRSAPQYQKACLERDWNDAVVAEKMKRIADTVLQINGKGPDVLILVEVENIRVLKQLNDKYLKAAKYKTVELIEGDDERGIDIGILSRLPLAASPTLHKIKFTKKPYPKTRGIMEAPLQLPNGQTLYVMGLHFPSQANPHNERVDAVNTLNDLLAEKSPNSLVVVGGDFNITADEDASSGLFSKVLAANWQVSHLVGCDTCKGSHFYRGEWSFLDALLFSNGLSAQNGGQWRLDTASIRTPTEGKYQMTKDNTPSRFNEKYPTGVSDHLPMYGEIYLK